MGEQAALKPGGRVEFFALVGRRYPVDAVVPAGALRRLGQRRVLQELPKGENAFPAGRAVKRDPHIVPGQHLGIGGAGGELQADRGGGGALFRRNAHAEAALRGGAVSQLAFKKEISGRDGQVGDKAAVGMHLHPFPVYGERDGGGRDIAEDEGFLHGGQRGAVGGVDEIYFPGAQRYRQEREQREGEQGGRKTHRTF